MDAQTRKALRRIIRCFILFLVLRLVEELLIIPHLTNTFGLIACLGGFAILLIYIRFINKPLEKIGMIFSEHKVRKGVVLAAVFNLVPAVVVYTSEYLRAPQRPDTPSSASFTIPCSMRNPPREPGLLHCGW